MLSLLPFTFFLNQINLCAGITKSCGKCCILKWKLPAVNLRTLRVLYKALETRYVDQYSVHSFYRLIPIPNIRFQGALKRLQIPFFSESSGSSQLIVGRSHGGEVLGAWSGTFEIGTWRGRWKSGKGVLTLHKQLLLFFWTFQKMQFNSSLSLKQHLRNPASSKIRTIGNKENPEIMFQRKILFSSVRWLGRKRIQTW